MTKITEVLTRLEGIIEWAKANNSPLGYFPVIYYAVTDGVKKGIDQGLFDDGARMENMDVIFAKRYLAAFDAWQAGQPVTQSWQKAFQAADNQNLTVIQHISLGMNAHINLDLGIATAQVSPGADIGVLRADFDRINDIIANLTDLVQDRLSEIFPPFRLLDNILRARDERMASVTIRTARLGAWTAATALAAFPEADQAPLIRELDAGVAMLARGIEAPGRWLQSALHLARWGEIGSVQRKIEKLQQD